MEDRWAEARAEQDRVCAEMERLTMAGENGRLARIEEKIDMLLDRTQKIPTECVQHDERIGQNQRTLRTWAWIGGVVFAILVGIAIHNAIVIRAAAEAAVAH